MQAKRIFNPAVFLVPDLLWMYAALYITIFFKYGQAAGKGIILLHLKIFTPIFFAWLLVFYIYQLFELETLRHHRRLLLNLAAASLSNFGLAAIYFFYQPKLILTPRRFLLAELLLTFVLVLSWHLWVKHLLKNKLYQEVYFFPAQARFAELAEYIRSHDYLGYVFMGSFVANMDLPNATLDLANDLPATIEIAANKIRPAAAVIFAPDLAVQPEMYKQLFRLRKQGIHFYKYDEFYEMLFRKTCFDHVNELWFLENISYRRKVLYDLFKRIMDIIAGLLLMLVFAITFIPIALAIKLSGKGPIFFIQPRVGKDRRIFKIYKYRTMSVDSSGHGWTALNDPRITTIGRILRLTSLDELPQFINLFLGTLSLVGPRPEQISISAEMQKAIPFFEERLQVKPGITGWAQLNIYAANVDETRLKLQYDLYYIKNRSLAMDLEIMLKTIYYVFIGRGNR